MLHNAQKGCRFYVILSPPPTPYTHKIEIALIEKKGWIQMAELNIKTLHYQGILVQLYFWMLLKSGVHFLWMRSCTQILVPSFQQLFEAKELDEKFIKNEFIFCRDLWIDIIQMCR
jgi:hypothetical protein